MKDRLLRIMSPGRALRRADQLRNKPWCYAGTTRRLMKQLEASLGAGARVDLGEPITRMALRLKQPFLDWVGALGSRQSRPLEWWATALGSPDPQETDLLAFLSVAELLRAWALSPQDRPASIVVLDDPWLLRMLQDWFARDPAVAVEGASRWRCWIQQAGWLLLAPKRWAAMLVLASSTALRARRLFRPEDERLSEINQAVVLYTWVQSQCFPSAGQPVDRWTGRLEQLLSDAGIAVRRLSPVTVPKALVTRLKEFSVPFIVTARYLSWADILRALCVWIQVEGARSAIWQGRDIGLLLRREVWRTRGQGTAGYLRLEYMAMRRVARRWAFRTGCVIYPFENQAWEKLLCLAWRQEAPGVRLVGYQHSSVPPLLVTYALGRLQRDTMPLPDFIVANGQANLRRLLDNGFPANRLINGGSLRYEYLHRPAAADKRLAHPSTVLVTLPLALEPARTLLMDLLETFEDPLFLQGRAVQFLIKCHPALDRSQLHASAMALPAWVQWSQERLETLLTTVDVLLYAGSTCSWWEAFLSGVSVIRYLTGGLELDGVGPVDGVTLPLCAKDTLRSTLARVLTSGRRPRPEEQTIEQVFGKVDEALWIALAEGRSPAPQHEEMVAAFEA